MRNKTRKKLANGVSKAPIKHYLNLFIVEVHVLKKL